jgi:hypothetical protein
MLRREIELQSSKPLRYRVDARSARMPKLNGHKPGGPQHQGKILADGSLKITRRKAQSL